MENDIANKILFEIINIKNQLGEVQTRAEKFYAKQEKFNARQKEFNAKQEKFNARQEEFNARQEKINEEQSKINEKLLKGQEEIKEQISQFAREQGDFNNFFLTTYVMKDLPREEITRRLNSIGRR